LEAGVIDEQSMRRDWNERARKDAFFYIASWRKAWDSETFFLSGEEDYERLVAPLVRKTGFLTSGKTLLELGCGAGRMTRTFARHFERVMAFDISEEMIARAQDLLRGTSNIAWFHGNGNDLREAPDQSADFVFSYLVLQHLPSEKLVEGYIREMLRVLRGKGLCLFQFNGSKQSNMNWKGNLAWKIIDSLWVMKLRGLSRTLAGLAGLDPEMAGKSWHGISMNSRRVAEMVQEGGGTLIEILGEDTPMAWCSTTKGIPLKG
jgi:SAM-dependent methyltransferase